MKAKRPYKIALSFFLLTFLAGNIYSQRPMEKLDRSVVAQKVTGGVYVNWRITSDEWYNASYKLYRDGNLVYESGTTGASNYLDPSGTTSSVYTVTTVKNGTESVASTASAINTKGYIEIPMRNIKTLGKIGYYLNDCTAADLDGDGQMEIIVKRMNRDWSTTNTNFTFFEAYKLDGTFLWAIDVGPNITMDVEINIAAFDFDGDGKAEVFMKTSDNTVFGDGKSVGDRDGDGVTNYRYSASAEGFMNAGPEYLSLIDGLTGAELDWVNFIARGNSNDWGDGYGHRANKFFFGAPYLDGIHASIFIGRGIYTQTKMATYDVVNKKMVARWTWESGTSGIYYAQGNHNYTLADVDGDGCDEIVWGSMCVDHNGTGLYSTNLGHGDAMHVGDFDPYYKGIEVFACNEANSGTNLREGATGKILMRHVTPGDCGRCGAGNISDSFKGAEIWGGAIGASATSREKITHFGVAENYTVYWDGDLLKEICDHTGFSTGTGVGYGQITKFNGYGNISSLLTADAYSCNYTKGTPCLQADLVGDWREEEIWWRKDSLALRIYITPYKTNYRIYTLLHDHQYRQAIAWQMCGYNQPPHTSFYLGSDFPTPIPAKSTNGKLVWKGASSTWDTSSANWVDGDIFTPLIAGTGNAIAFSNGKQVLFDTHGTSRTITISENLSPELLMVSGTSSYTFDGSGSLTGMMRLDKLGSGSVTLSGAHSYTGNTDVWEGDMWMNGALSGSQVMVRRHANYGGTGTSGNGISTEFNAVIYVGGKSAADTMKVNGTLKLAAGAKLFFDLSDNPEIHANPLVNTSSQKNDFIYINGTLDLTAGSIFSIHQTIDSLLQGDYLLGKVDAVTGDLTKVKVEGTLGLATELIYESVSKKLYMRVKGVRSVSSITWTGDNSVDWDMAKTTNWSNQGVSDIFVAYDSVFFKTEGINRTINLIDNIPVSYMEVNSALDYSFNGTGLLTGSMNLYKTNSGTLTLNTRNSYTGRTIVDQGTLIMKYAPSTTDNGGIGINSSNVANLVVADSAIIKVSTASEICIRGMTVSGTLGGLIDVPSSLYWNGAIAGTRLTKIGSGTLYIGNNNTSLSETVLQAGKIKLNTDASVINGIGSKITLNGGTLETLNSTGAYLTSNNAFVVPSGHETTIIAGARCEYNGTLTGGGTLNWVCDYIRAYINGNWSAFDGRINITANGANSTYENHFIVNNAAGFPNATFNLGNGVLFCYKNGTSDNGTTTLRLGMLTGVTGSTYYNAGLEVGSNGESGTFGGAITGVTSVKKVGTGSWELSGTNTYSGTTTLSGGSIKISGTKTRTGTVTAAAGTVLNVTGTLAGAVTLGGTAGSTIGARLTGNGTLSGNVIFENGSAISPGDSTTIATLKFSSNLTMGVSVYEAQVSGGVMAISDKITVTGTLACGGILKIKRLDQTPLLNGHSIQLFSAGNIAGAFSEIILPVLSEGLEWNTSNLYTTGMISIVQSTGISGPAFQAGLMKNPTYGLFSVYLENIGGEINVSVFNLQGQLVFSAQERVLGGAFAVDIRSKPKGIYILKMFAEDNKYNMLKLIKE